jgi:hypothetical protein
LTGPHAELLAAIEGRGFAFSGECDVTLKGFSGQHRIAAVEWR